MTFEQFYKKLGLKAYPFTTFTTELERGRAQELFVPMTEYGPIVESFNNRSNVILLGERGVGKTAVLEAFHRQTAKGQVSAIIGDFVGLPLEPTAADYHVLILQSLLVSFIKNLRRHPFVSLRLSRKQRVLLSYLIYFYSDDLTVESIKEAIDRTQVPLPKRLAAKVVNSLRRPLNYAGTVVENALKRYIAQQFGSVPPCDETAIHEYFPQIELTVERAFRGGVDSFYLVRLLSETILHATQLKPVALFDRLDEDTRLANDAELISDFVKPLLTDNALLSLDTLQTVAFVWKTPYRYIEDHVRSQKYFCPTIRWSEDSLGQVLDRRLSVFSDGALSDHRRLFSGVPAQKLSGLFSLANGVPRDLWHLMNKLFEEQFRRNPSSDCFEPDSIESAMERFVTEFNYYEYYPRKINARRDTMDIYSYYAHLQKVATPEFTKNRLNDLAGTGGSTTNYVIGMERIGLVEKIRQDRGELIFRIRDNKIIFAMSKGIDLRAKT